MVLSDHTVPVVDETMLHAHLTVGAVWKICNSDAVHQFLDAQTWGDLHHFDDGVSAGGTVASTTIIRRGIQGSLGPGSADLPAMMMAGLRPALRR